MCVQPKQGKRQRAHTGDWTFERRPVILMPSVSIAAFWLSGSSAYLVDGFLAMTLILKFSNKTIRNVTTLSNKKKKKKLLILSFGGIVVRMYVFCLQPNGRFEINKKICLSISGHHPESWQPSWSCKLGIHSCHKRPQGT